MKAPAPVRPVLIALAGLGLLSGCGAQNAARTVVPQGAVAQARRHAPMSPDLRGTYLYVADSSGYIYVYKNYPKIKRSHAQVIRGFGPRGLCSDKDGNVFATGVGGGVAETLEFAHGGTTPIATLPDSPYNATIVGCAVDQDSENLAVANAYTHGSNPTGNVLVYAGAQGTPTAYTDSDMTEPAWCAYDSAGNLYVGGTNATGNVVYAILRKGSTSLVTLNISGLQPNVFGGIAWDGKYLVVLGSVTGSDAKQVYQIQVSGSSGTIVNKVTLDGFRIGGGMVIYDGQLLMPIDQVRVARWAYPAGGAAKEPQQILGDIVTDEAISAKPQK